MILLPSRSRQPARDTWPQERLLHERAVVQGHASDPTTAVTYCSYLQSYLTFFKIHNFPIDPTADTLSFYVVFMAHHIKPQSFTSYLSGICNSLEPYFPSVCAIRNGALVSRMLARMKKLWGGSDRKRKWPLTEQGLIAILECFNSGNFNDLLFIPMMLTTFHALLRVGELTMPDSPAHRSSLKTIMCHTCTASTSQFSFCLPFHKGDRFFDGNTILVEHHAGSPISAYPAFTRFLDARDLRFPRYPELWLTSDGRFPYS